MQFSDLKMIRADFVLLFPFTLPQNCLLNWQILNMQREIVQYFTST